MSSGQAPDATTDLQFRRVLDALSQQSDNIGELASEVRGFVQSVERGFGKLSRNGGSQRERVTFPSLFAIVGALAAFGAFAVGGLATFGGFALANTISDLHAAESGIESLDKRFRSWTSRVLPLDAAQSKSIAETERFQQMMWNRLIPNESYPEMRTPAPAVQP